MGEQTFGLKSVKHRLRSVERTAGSLVLVIASLMLPVSMASAAPMPQTTAVVSQVGPEVPTASAQQDRRLANGQFVRAGSRTGEGHMAINNNASHDGVVTLTRNRNAAYSVYIRKGMQFTVTGIRDGNYETYFTVGTDWDSQARAFTRDRAFKRFDNPLQFTTTSRQTTIWNITLSGVVGGNAKSSDVDPNTYPTP